MDISAISAISVIPVIIKIITPISPITLISLIAPISLFLHIPPASSHTFSASAAVIDVARVEIL